MKHLGALFKDLSNKRPQLTNNFDGRRDYDQLQSDYCIRDSAGFVEIGTSKNVSKCRTLNSINEINRTPLLEIGETELRGASLQFQLSSPRHGNAIGDLTHSGSFNRTRKNQNEIGALHGSLPPRPLKDRNLLPRKYSTLYSAYVDEYSRVVFSATLRINVVDHYAKWRCSSKSLLSSAVSAINAAS